MEAKMEQQSILSQIDNRLKLAVFLTPFMHFYLPYIGEIVVLCFQISIIWLIYNINKISYYSSLKPLYIFTAIYISSITISNLILLHRLGWSIETLVSFFRYLVLISHFIFILSLAKYFSLSDKLPFDYLPQAILIAISLLFIDINFNLTNIDYNEGLRIITSSNIRHLGHIVIVSTLYLSIKVLMGEKLNNILFILSTITSISLLIWLGGRGAILSYSLGLMLAFIIITKHHKLEIKRLVSLLLLIVFSIIISIPFNIYSWNGLNRLLDTKQYYSQDINTISTSRIELWSLSGDFIKEKPLFGYGAESFILNSETIFRHPHNFIVQWLFDFGVIGTLLFLLLIIYILLIGYKNTERELNIVNLLSIVIFTGILSNAIISGTLYYSPPFLILCITSGFILSQKSS